ncbi:hypothetical protein EIM50_23915 [Pseudoxanthomonas sp. SGD-10]|nr:hypothetical protein EIM50_23915 [Pseudoxanthomonas sp. SGD-10]
MKNLLLAFSCMFLSIACYAQEESLSNSPLKFLSAKQYEYYIKGNNPELSKVAEINNYPSPKTALKLEKQLSLTTDQKSQIKTIATEMDRKLAEMGKFLIAEQTKLNALFESRKINEGSLIYHTNKIGSLEGELRNAYLKAHLRTWKVLTLPQLKKYEELNNKKR